MTPQNTAPANLPRLRTKAIDPAVQSDGPAAPALTPMRSRITMGHGHQSRPPRDLRVWNDRRGNRRRHRRSSICRYAPAQRRAQDNVLGARAGHRRARRAIAKRKSGRARTPGTGAMTDTNVRHVVSVSGGKDSDATLFVFLRWSRRAWMRARRLTGCASSNGDVCDLTADKQSPAVIGAGTPRRGWSKRRRSCQKNRMK